MTTRTRYYQTIREPRPAIDWRAMLTQIGFGLALALVAGRCMVMETVRDPFDVRVGGSPTVLGAGANTSVVLDLLCCLPAILVLARRCLDKTYTIRWSVSLLLLAPVAAWMALSVKWADDKFADVISTCNFLAALALLWSMAQFVRSWARLRIVAAVAYGLLLAFLVRGFYYKFVDMPSMLAQQSLLLKQGGLDPHSYTGIQFAKKITELMGFNASANSFAGLLVLFMTIGLGVAIQRIKDRDDPGWSVTLALSAPLAIWLLIYTRSKAAMVMPVLVIALLAILWKWRGPMATQSKRYFWIGVGIVLLAIAAVVGHGLYHHGLPTDSLNFRWRYWVASMRMFRRHPIIGVGWDNFGPHYLRDRLPAASEEIRDPHDFLVRFLVELGLVGFTFMIAWLGRLWWELTRPAFPPATASSQAPSKKPNWGPVIFVAAIAVAAIVINIFSSIDFNQSGSWVFVELVNRLLYLCALLLGSLIVALRSLENPQLDERPAPWILYGILVGAGVFLIHNLIEFSMFEAGPCCLLGILLGAALGVRLPNPPVRTPRVSLAAIIALAATCAGWLAIGYWTAMPLIQAEMAAHRGDDELRAGDFQFASDEYAYAASRVPMNADYAFRAGRALHLWFWPPGPLGVLTDPIGAALAEKLRPGILTWYAIAIHENPSFLDAYQLRAIFSLQMDDADQMIADFEKVMELNPNEVSLRLQYAGGLEALRRFPEARQQYKLALSYNDLLDKGEPKRLSAEEESAIEKDMNSLPD
jgi:O-antigen ligase/tetratricopeptide (TPR) repeat protein